LRISLYLAHYPSPGGTTYAVREFSQALARAGVQTTILCRGQEEKEWSEGSVTVHSFHSPHHNLPFIVPASILNHLRENLDETDLLVLNGMFHPDVPALARAARAGQIPYIVAPHSPYSSTVFSKNRTRKKIYWKIIEKRILQRAAAVQVLAEAHCTYLRKLGVFTPVIVLPNGAPRPHSPLPPIRKRNSRHVTFGYLGRLDAWVKGLDLLIRGFGRAARQFGNLRLVLQGPDWGDAERLRNLAAQLCPPDSVTFKDPVYGDSVAIISEWDVLILPSRFDGFGISVLEAMLAGTPIICSSAAGAAEHVVRAECGIVIEPSEKGVLDGIATLMRSRDKWQDMGERGRTYAQNHLSWDEIGRAAIESYSRILGALHG